MPFPSSDADCSVDEAYEDEVLGLRGTCTSKLDRTLERTLNCRVREFR